MTNGSLDVTVRNGDLSCESCDAIVNPTNVSMRPDGGLDTIIHQHMGQFFTDQVVAIHQEMKNGSCPRGQSRIFIAKFNREENDPRFIISTVGPVYTEAEKDRAGFLLQSCYHTSLALANLYQLSSIAYPAISCGANQFPPNEAARIAIESVRNYSYNVRDVRFVLHDPNIFKIFVQEWTNYANQITINTEQISVSNGNVKKIPPPIPPKPSLRYCVLCKERQLSIDQPLICTSCSNLRRPELFTRFLGNLRAAADESYVKLENECKILEPILDRYPLIYNPAQKFDIAIHPRDSIAEHYLQNYCDKEFRNAMPMSIVGDGNCFYNTFVKLGSAGTTIEASSLTAVELRARNIVELVVNIDKYKSQYSNLETILDPFEEYARKEMVRDTNYASVWDFVSIASVLNIQVRSIYPKVNGEEDLYYHSINNKLYAPLSKENSVNKQINETNPAEVKILFSHCNRPFLTISLVKKKEWLPNHFVPLLSI